jgi:hypothetical protein
MISQAFILCLTSALHRCWALQVFSSLSVVLFAVIGFITVFCSHFIDGRTCFSYLWQQFSFLDKLENHVKWLPCHHGMARTQVADGGDSLQIWRVAANILNKKSLRADRGWSSSLGVRRGLATPHRKTYCMLRNVLDCWRGLVNAVTNFKFLAPRR